VSDVALVVAFFALRSRRYSSPRGPLGGPSGVPVPVTARTSLWYDVEVPAVADLTAAASFRSHGLRVQRVRSFTRYLFKINCNPLVGNAYKSHRSCPQTKSAKSGSTKRCENSGCYYKAHTLLLQSTHPLGSKHTLCYFKAHAAQRRARTTLLQGTQRQSQAESFRRPNSFKQNL
jgi:hypothetical protein